MYCNLCPRNCNAERQKENGKGFCKSGTDPRIARVSLHEWEEPCISGTRGSGTIFFSGCNIGCIYCQNYAISHDRFGQTVSVARLAEIFREIENRGAHNINLVTPTHFTPAIMEALSVYKPKIPVVYNCGGYEKTDTIRSLDGYVDVFLVDLKYYAGELAEKYSNAPQYFSYASKAIQVMREQTGPAVYDKDGIMQKGTIIRHMVLPGCVDDSMQIINWYKNNVKDGTPLSIMSQYLPCGEASSCPEMDRRISKIEYDKVLNYLLEQGIEEGWVQDRRSALKKYIPDFNLEGVF